MMTQVIGANLNYNEEELQNLKGKCVKDVKTTYALNNMTQYVYDRNNRLKQMIDAVNHSNYKYYDGVSDVIKSVSTEGDMLQWKKLGGICSPMSSCFTTENVCIHSWDISARLHTEERIRAAKLLKNKCFLCR